MTALVLAGGRGTRMSPHGNKLTLDVGGTPWIRRMIDSLYAGGIDHVVIALGHGHPEIAQALKGIPGSRLTTLVEPKPLGTGGAVGASLPYLPPEGFYVLNGDTIVEVNYRRVWRARDDLGSRSLMLTYPCSTGNTHVVNGIILTAYDKGDTSGNCVDCGGIYTPGAWVGHPPSPYDMEWVIKGLIRRRELEPYPIPTRPLEVGSETGLAEARRLYGTHT